MVSINCRTFQQFTSERERIRYKAFSQCVFDLIFIYKDHTREIGGVGDWDRCVRIITNSNATHRAGIRVASHISRSECFACEYHNSPNIHELHELQFVEMQTYVQVEFVQVY